ncbi:MAG: hypothetical protein IT534_04850 [Bauldia sp.]|nr:hypothetical protein [Bauldia sp.]
MSTPQVQALKDAIIGDPGLVRDYIRWSNSVRAVAGMGNYSFSLAEALDFHEWLGTESATNWASAGFGGVIPP